MAHNFLQESIGEVRELTLVDFMKIWNHYDVDKSGYIECLDKADGSNEFRDFVRDYLAVSIGHKTKSGFVSEDNVEESMKYLMEAYDRNHNQKFELGELLSVLPVEENFMSQFKAMSYKESDFQAIFHHYDQDNSGSLQEEEIDGLIRDLLAMNKNGGKEADISAFDIADMREQLMEVADLDRNGMLDYQELAQYLGGKRE